MSEPISDPTSTPDWSLGKCLQWSAGLLAIAAAGIHFGVMGEHAGVSWSHGLFFAFSAWLQLAFAGWILWRPTRSAAIFGVVLNAAIIAVWIVSRAAGIPIGGDGSPEAFGFSDTLCALFEFGAIAACIGLLSPSVAASRISRLVGVIGVSIIGVVAVSLATAAFTPTFVDTQGDGHDHAASANGAGHAHGGATVAAPVATNADGFPLFGTTPCEKAGPPASKGQVLDAEGHDHRGPYAQELLTPAERQSLVAEQEQARAVAIKYPTVAT
ncbi:MAG: hypothetical protein F2723_04315, partial [Actinobacteria bacterium]|nr:hypothetical protein [Actinomycetota bacterium]